MATSELIERDLCHVDELANNSVKEIEIKLEDSNNPTAAAPNVVKVLLVKNNEKISCIAARCTHYDVPLSFGVLYNGRIRCMAHGACFNVESGDIEEYPGVDSLPHYNVSVNNKTGIIQLKTTRQELETKRRVKTSETAALFDDCKSLNDRPLSRVSSAGCHSNDSSLRATNPTNLVLDPIARKSARILPRCLIIGSGSAGLICLDTLREHGYGSNITMITKESYPPYDRPKLSKALDSKIGAISLRSIEFFTNNNINFHMNQEVDKIEFDNRKVICKSGNTFNYDRLVIATGLRASKSSTAGSHLQGIFTLRSLDDANNIIKYFNSLRDELSANNSSDTKLNVVLVGGSFISMEAASFFASKANTLVMSRRKPFESVFGTNAALKILKLHEKNGVKFLIENFNIVQFKESPERAGELGEIILENGTKYPADICILAIGGQPVTDFLRNSPIKLTLENFVIVDKNMKTNLDNVFAAGDIAYFPRSCLPGFEFTLNKHNSKLDHINIGHWGLAGSQGKSAALAIINQTRNEKLESELRVVPFFWSTQFGKSIRFAGYNDNHDSIVFHEDPSKQNELKFAAFYILSNRVIAVCTLDWDPICAIYAEAMYNRIEVRREHIEKDPMDLKKLLN